MADTPSFDAPNLDAPSFDRVLEHRLTAYCAIDSQSDEHSATSPSTEIQLNVAKHLIEELNKIGAVDVKLTPYGAVLATVPATVPAAPTIGFCAHMDTAPQFNATDVKPRVIRNWDGTDITYPDNADLILSPQTSAYLSGKEGEDIITASGRTLLGADDKAGIAIIMTLAEHLLTTPGLKHGKIRLAFTPDEEIGRGVHADLPADFGVDFAYTLDGGPRGTMEYETFSADGAVVTITGTSAHPGYAKDKLTNALHVAAQIISDLDESGTTPETTSGRESFTHVYAQEGGSSETTLRFILRAFEMEDLAEQTTRLKAACAKAEADFPGSKVTCDITKQYRNMRYWLENDMTPVELAREAIRTEGFDPKSVPIRGGTDGSRLTELGVPCPNLYTGMMEIHGPLEWISVQDMASATRMCLNLVQIAAK
ncbi:peptidase T [Shimia marina]|uniref:Peptidase T n=1 Tax=Shimia marina TaxID=321267 RepID=A0A0P1ERE8_9RHOB|nr:peptidase T [Shimia marina]CUH53075.1 Peptidase T [Shimia marina]SFE43979.1 tripeptide aminopeptidase [Shimia marina]